jgi:hypothetical protein
LRSSRVVGITHTNSNLKNAQQSMRLFLPLPKAKFDGRTNSIYYYYYYAAYTLNALIMEAVTVVHDPFCEVCGAGMTSPSCVKSQAGGSSGCDF